MGKRPDYVWVIAHIKRDYIKTVEQDLLEKGFGAIKVFIPTVRILKKQFKNKNIYEYVPLLFNYGFFQLPYIEACNYEFLVRLRAEIPAIYSWVSDPIKVLKDKPHLRIDNSDEEEVNGEEEINEDGMKILKKPENDISIATATEKEIANLLTTSEHMSVFSDDLVDKLETGSFITLKGYPYEGMPAEVTYVNKNTKKVKVRLLLETMMHEVSVSFENIFYTVYSNYNEEGREKSLDEIDQNGKRNLDRLYAQINYGED